MYEFITQNYIYYPFTLITFVMCCCWFDRYCLKKYCERKPELVLPRQRNNSISDYSDSEIETKTDSETDSETASERDSETDSERDSERDTSDIEMIIKPDYDEDTVYEYGRPLALG